MKKRRWVRRMLIGVLSLILGFFLIVFPIAASFLITNSRFRFPERGPTRAADVGMDVESIQFKARDGINLKGWWNSGKDEEPIIIFAHGLNRSRLEMLERAAEANKRGYGVLLFDLRNHGESDSAYTTLGIHEARDVCAASQIARDRAPGRPQLLWGVSMGAATALLAARDCPGFMGIVSDSAFVSFRETVSHHLKLYFRLPGFPIANLIIAITGLRMGFNPDVGDVESAVRDFGNVPVLFIAGSNDKRMPPDVAQRLFNAAQSPEKELVIIPGAGHGEAFRTDRRRYLDAVFRFFAIIRHDDRSSH